MERLTKVLVVILVVLILISAVAAYVLQYRNLEVDVDRGQSGVDIVGFARLTLTIVLRFTNTGSVDLTVPPTTFDVWTDGIYAGPGKSESVGVPAGGSAWSTATVEVSSIAAPAAYLALVDEGKDTIRLKGEAHVDVWFFTLDYPFDESFQVDA